MNKNKGNSVKKLGVSLLVIGIIAGISISAVFLYERGLSRKYQSAVMLYEQGEQEKALPLFKKLAKRKLLNDYQEESFYYLALIKQDLNHDDAGLLWNKIFETSPSVERRAEALFYLAKNEYDNGNFDEAAKKFNQVVSDYPLIKTPYYKSLYYIGELEYKKGLNNYLKARKIFENIINSESGDVVKGMAKARLGEINIKLLLSPVLTPESEIYTVNPGDSLASIANRFNTTIALIKRSNNLTSNFIRPGDRLKVSNIKFKIVISKKNNTLRLLVNGKFFKEYLVGTGKYNKTPVGKFKIINKIKEPVWYHPEGGVIPYGDPANLLGTRWMGINFPGYGIHGTWDDDSVGKQSSAGCVRLVNSDIEELFLIIKENTEVEITER
ncbi:L,D-transpeptidase family protein [bacterium]|nr:L,D-transpeptidase family protein [bacterium]